MQKLKTIIRTIENKVVDEVFCNKCEKEIELKKFEEYYTGYHCGGFYSKLGDMSEYQFDLCETCLNELFKTFKIDPFVKNTLQEDIMTTSEMYDKKLNT